MRRISLVVTLLLAGLLSAPAAPKKKAPMAPTPTLADVAYGEHPKQVLHFWKAKSAEPTPLLFFIHGAPPAMGKDQKDPTHTANFGVGLCKRMRELGVECTLNHPGTIRKLEHKTVQSWLIDRLTRGK